MPSGTEKSPSPRKIARLPASGGDYPCKAYAIPAARIKTASPDFAAARRLTGQSADMAPNVREGAAEAEESPLGGFARDLQRDQDAVAAALREPWSNGQAEGRTDRLETLERRMHGRANIEPLGIRILGQRRFRGWSTDGIGYRE